MEHVRISLKRENTPFLVYAQFRTQNRLALLPELLQAASRGMFRRATQGEPVIGIPPAPFNKSA
jgi:hypothetical protein